MPPTTPLPPKLNPIYRILSSPIFNKIFAYQLPAPQNRYNNLAGGAVAGNVLGMAHGAASVEDSDSRKEKLYKILQGAAKGSAVGIGAATVAPKLMSKAVGRVVTNVVRPKAYELKDQADMIRARPIKEIIKSLASDTSIHPELSTAKPTIKDRSSGREAVFRDMFSLKSRNPEASEMFRELKPPRKAKKHIRKVWEFNPKTDTGRAELADANTIYTAPDIIGLNDGNAANIKTKGGSSKAVGDVMGGVYFHPGGRYSDDWDFAMNPGEKIDSKVKLVRALVNMFTSPVTIAGNATYPPAMPTAKK